MGTGGCRDALGWGFRGTSPWGQGHSCLLLPPPPPPLLPAPKLSLVLPGGTMDGTIGTPKSAPQHPKILTPQQLGGAFLHCEVTQAGEVGGGTGAATPHSKAEGMEEGESPGWDGAEGAEPHRGVPQGPARGQGPPSSSGGGRGAGGRLLRWGRGQGQAEGSVCEDRWG